jgi:hypothetical protein
LRKNAPLQVYGGNTEDHSQQGTNPKDVAGSCVRNIWA